MAHTFWLLANRESLPTAARIKNAFVKAKLPVAFVGRWDWSTGGWLPMHWRKTETGCEVELEKLTKKEIAAARKAGCLGVDAKVVITIRGWDSLKVGVAFAAIVAQLSHGCVSESDNEYVAAEKALKWAKDAIADADKQARLEKVQDKAREIAQAASTDEQLQSALSAMSGLNVKDIRFGMSVLGVVMTNGARISGSAWRVIDRDGKCHAQDRYASIRSRQMDLLSGTASAAKTKQARALDELLEKAGSEDAAEAISAQAEVATWSKNLRIKSASWQQPNWIRLLFDEGMSIEFVGGMFGEVTCSVPPLTFAIGRDGARLR
jgi:hypothetical protein